MGRFIYNPMTMNEYKTLVQQRKEFPASGELMVDDSLYDIYVIDDYGIPIQSTNTLRNRVNSLNSGILLDIDNKRELVKKPVNDLELELKEFEKKQISLEVRNDILKNDTGFVEQHNVYIDNISKYNAYRLGILDIRLGDRLNLADSYKQRLMDLQTRFNNISSNLTNTIDVNNTKKELGDIWLEIQNFLYVEINKKINNLGVGRGQITVNKPKTVTGYYLDYGWFRWMSNNSKTYGGDGSAACPGGLWSQSTPNSDTDSNKYRIGVDVPRDEPLDLLRAEWKGAAYWGGSNLNDQQDAPYRPIMGIFPTEIDNTYWLKSDRSQDPDSTVQYYRNGIMSSVGIINYYGKLVRVTFGGNVTKSVIITETITI